MYGIYSTECYIKSIIIIINNNNNAFDNIPNREKYNMIMDIAMIFLKI